MNIKLAFLVLRYPKILSLKDMNHFLKSEVPFRIQFRKKGLSIVALHNSKLIL